MKQNGKTGTRLIILFTLLFLSGNAAFAQDYLDQYYLTGQTVNFNRAQADVYNAGSIFAIGDYSPGTTVEYAIIKTDTFGNLRWAHQLNFTGNGNEPFSISPDKYNSPSTGMIISGMDENANPFTFGQYANIVRIDSSGTANLSIDFSCKTYFGDGIWTVGHVVKATPGNNYYYMGSMIESGGSAAVAGGGYEVGSGGTGYDPHSDIFIAKINTSASHDTVFTQTIGLGYNFLLSGIVNCDSTRNDAPEDFVYDKATNGLYVTGLTVDQYSPGGGQWRVQLFIMKTDTFGIPQWAKTFYWGTGNPSTTTAWESGQSIVQINDGSGDYMVAGLIQDDAGILLIRISNTGNVEYAKEYTFGAGSAAAARSVKMLSNGHVLVGAWVIDAASGGQSDMVAMEVNPLNMSVVNAIQVGTPGLDGTDFTNWYGPGVEQIAPGSLMLLGNASVGAGGNYGLMVAKFSGTSSNSGLCSTTPTVTVTDVTPGVSPTPIQVRTWVPGNNYTTAPNNLITRVGSAGGGYTEKHIDSLLANPPMTNITPNIITGPYGTSPTVTVSASGTTTFCKGGNVTLNAGGSATSFTWSPATGLSATTGASVVAGPPSTTTYTVTGTAAGTCVPATATIVVTVNPLPPITITPGGATTFCSGGTVTLTGNGAGAGGTYTWSPATGLSATSGSSVTANPASTETYTVTGTNTNGCSNTATVTITINTTPTLTATAAPPTICTGGSTTLTSTGATTYTWTPSTGLTITTGASVVAAPASTITYTVTGSSAAGCTATQTVVVTVASGVTISVTPSSPSVCKGDSITLTASGASNYTWKPAGSLSCTNCPNPNAGPGANTTYTIVGSNGSCSDSTKVTVTVNPTPTVNVTPAAPTICSGANILLTASGAANYTWSPSGSLTASTGTSVTASPGSTTTYTVVGTNGSGCKDSATAVVTVSPAPVVSIAITGISPAVCESDTVGMIASGANTYTWSPSTGLNVTTGIHVIANPVVTTTYTVTGTTAGGCIGTATQIITIYPTPTVSISPATPVICAGTSTTITATGASTYTWSPATGLSATTGATVTDSSAITQTYTVVGINGNGCTDTTTVTVSVTPPPVVTVAPASPAICTGGNVNLTAGGASNYTWSPSAGLSATTGANVNATPSVTTTYTVTGTSGICSDTQSVVITVSGSLNVSVTPSAPNLCNGDSVSLSANGAANFVWSPSIGLSCSTCPNTEATPTVTTTYKVVGSSGTCSDSANVTITVNPIPTVSASAGNPSICSGNSTVLTATGATNYVWTPSTGLSASTGSTVNASPGTTLTYTVVGSNLGGCSDSAVVSITVNVTPTITISSSGSDSICVGQNVTLTANGGAGNYLWSNGSTNSSITVSPSGTTTYSVTGSNGTCADSAAQAVYVYPPIVVTMKGDSICASNNATVSVNVTGGAPAYAYTWSNGATGVTTISVAPGSNTYYICTVTDGCGDRVVDSSEVFTFSAPKAAFSPTPDTVLGGQYVTFVNNSTNATSYYWTFGNETSSNTVMPYIQYINPGSYLVTLIASNGGCRDSVSDTVYVTETIFIPNVFTPNNDGQNDVFHVTMGGMQTYHIEIFNRWGERLFMADSPEIDWDGRSSAGVDESDGIYYYLIKATDYVGRNHNFEGYLELIRN